MSKTAVFPEDIRPGVKFNRLTVLGVPFGVRSTTDFRWYCVVRCKCLKIDVAPVTYLRTGHKQSCGCLTADTMSVTMRTHGGRQEHLYTIWSTMRARCSNANDESYGGRGITVCPEWASDYATFRSWALANGYRRQLQIDRRDNSKGYSPENCRFVTGIVNARNKRNNHVVEAFGETKCLAEWAEDPRCAVTYNALKLRISRRKWSPERALTTPSKRLR